MKEGEPQIQLLVAAVVINLMLGLMYSWSLFISALEQLLHVSRTTLSVVPTLTLLCATVGTYYHHSLIQRFPLGALVPGIMLLAGCGNLLFLVFPSYTGLLIGVGIVFGSSVGVGFGVALAFARQSFSPPRGWAVGLTVAAFAVNGMVVSVLGSIFGIPSDIPKLFGAIGVLFCCCAPMLWLLIRKSQLHFSDGAGRKQTPTTSEGPILLLTFSFFSSSYLGLVIVSHGTEILRDLGVLYNTASLMPFVFNSGYILGALVGGVTAAKFSARFVLQVFLVATTLSLFMMFLPLPTIGWFLAIFMIGVGFGSLVSGYLMLLVRHYGVDLAGMLFGRLNIGYGLAGFLAPLLTGWMFDWGGSYSAPLWFTVILGILGLCVLTGYKEPERIVS